MTCEYDMRASLQEDHCPECGTPFVAGANGEIYIQGQHAIASHDIPCTKCGYDLRASLHQDHCPECGEPFIVTPNGDVCIQGKYVIAYKGATLPRYCVRTGKPVRGEPLEHISPLSSHADFLVYYFRSSGRLRLGRFSMPYGAIPALAGLALTLFAILSSLPVLAGPGLVLFFFGLAIESYINPAIATVKYSGDWVWLKGCSHAFRARVTQDAARRRAHHVRSQDIPEQTQYTTSPQPISTHPSPTDREELQP